MTRARVSHLTFELIQGRISDVLARGGTTDPWVAEMMKAAGFDMDMNAEDEEGIGEQIDIWISNVGAEASRRNLDLVGEAAAKECDPRIVRLLIERGLNPTALLALSEMLEGQVAADLPFPGCGGERSNPQAGLVPGDSSDELMVPLTANVYWTGDRLLVRSGVIPETVLTALIGRPASAIVDHPAIAQAGPILSRGENQGSFDVLHMAPGDLVPWNLAIDLDDATNRNPIQERS